jgi:hypothetical protein
MWYLISVTTYMARMIFMNIPNCTNKQFVINDMSQTQLRARLRNCARGFLFTLALLLSSTASILHMVFDQQRQNQSVL